MTKQVVIIGAGFGGGTLAKYLDAYSNSKDIAVTLISPRENFFLYKVAGLRLATTSDGDEDGWANRVLIPLDKLMRNMERNKYIQGTVLSVDAERKTVLVQCAQTPERRELAYDVLIIASGSRNFSPGEPPFAVQDREGTKQYYASFRQALQRASSVTVLGAGATGIELCGEIRQYYPKMRIQCVTRAATILNGGATDTTPASFIRAMSNKLEKMRIKVYTKSEVESEQFDFTDANAQPWLVPKNDGKLVLKSGEVIETDLFVSAVGFQYNTGFLPEDWLDIATSQVLVDEYGQVKGANAGEVFCLGDAAKSGAPKLGYLASSNASIVGHNVLRALAGRTPNKKLQLSGLGFVLPLGEFKGRILVGGMLQLGDWPTSVAKGYDLFAWRHWVQYGHAWNTFPATKGDYGLVPHAASLVFGSIKTRRRRLRKHEGTDAKPVVIKATASD